MTLREQLVFVADTYCAATGRGRGTVSAQVMNRGSTLARMAVGEADVTTGHFERAMRWFSENWPNGTAWPDGIARPTSDSFYHDPALPLINCGENGAEAAPRHVNAGAAALPAEASR